MFIEPLKKVFGFANDKVQMTRSKYAVKKEKKIKEKPVFEEDSISYEEEQEQISRASETKSHFRLSVHCSIYHRIFGVYDQTVLPVTLHELL